MVFVRMKFQGKFSISFFQIFITSIFRNSKYFIVIFTFVYTENSIYLVFGVAFATFTTTRCAVLGAVRLALITTT